MSNQRCCKRKAQASLEYLVIVAIATFLLIPVISLFFTSSTESAQLANANLITVMGKKIVSEAENVFYQGKDTKLRLTFNFPENLKNMTVLSSTPTNPFELTMHTEFEGLQTEFVFFSNVNMTFSEISDPCNPSTQAPDQFLGEGIKDVFIRSCGKYVVMYVYEG